MQDESKDSFSVYHLFLVPTMIKNTLIFDKHLPLGKCTIDNDLCVRENTSMNVCLHMEMCMVRTMPSYIGSDFQSSDFHLLFGRAHKLLLFPSERLEIQSGKR